MAQAVSARVLCRCSAINTQPQQAARQPATQEAVPNVQLMRRRVLSLGAGAFVLQLAGSRPAVADEGPIDALVGTLVETEEDVRLKGTDLVKTLLERSELNRDKYKRELQDKYCYRQAEDGVGDCSGLRLIPGATKRGLQKRPGWLNSLFGQKDDAEGGGE